MWNRGCWAAPYILPPESMVSLPTWSERPNTGFNSPSPTLGEGTPPSPQILHPTNIHQAVLKCQTLSWELGIVPGLAH